jgi:hypothetical protein
MFAAISMYSAIRFDLWFGFSDREGKEGLSEFFSAASLFNCFPFAFSFLVVAFEREGKSSVNTELGTSWRFRRIYLLRKWARKGT